MHHHRKHKYDIIVFLAVAGFGVSLYLAITKYMGLSVPCGLTGGCEAVLNSKYSNLVGIPLPIWGSVFFISVIVSALLANHYELWKKILTGILSIGSVMALAFLSIQFFVLRQICQYCLITDLLTIALLLWDLNIEYDRIK